MTPIEKQQFNNLKRKVAELEARVQELEQGSKKVKKSDPKKGKGN